MKAYRFLCLTGLISLAGCGTVGDLERLQELQAKNQFAEIAAEPIPSDCASKPFKSEACPKIHAIRGRACLALARSETDANAACPPVTSPKARQWLECAVASYENAELPGLEPVEAARLGENRARALYCTARLREPKEAAVIARRAGSELARFPPTPERDLLAASSALFIAQQKLSPAAERCAAARQAGTLASRGLTGSPPAATSVANALQGTKTAAAQEAALIPECGGH